MASLTPFQTVGPFLHLGLLAGRDPMTAEGLTTPIAITGRLLDGAGAGIEDGALEVWAAGFDGIGRVWTDAGGLYRLSAVKPRSRVDSSGVVHAPHFAVRVLARGIQTQYVTRVYFDDEATNERDTILAAVPEDRRATLIAAAVAPAAYRFDIVVQGDRETVFFAL